MTQIMTAESAFVALTTFFRDAEGGRGGCQPGGAAKRLKNGRKYRRTSISLSLVAESWMAPYFIFTFPTNERVDHCKARATYHRTRHIRRLILVPQRGKLVYELRL